MSRTYRSPRRALQAQQTRVAVLGACRALFAERGWAATGVRDMSLNPDQRPYRRLPDSSISPPA